MADGQHGGEKTERCAGIGEVELGLVDRDSARLTFDMNGAACRVVNGGNADLIQGPDHDLRIDAVEGAGEQRITFRQSGDDQGTVGDTF